MARPHSHPKGVQQRGPRTRPNSSDGVQGQAGAQVGGPLHSQDKSFPQRLQAPPRRLSAQKSPKGAAGLAQQVRKNRSLPRRLSTQKSPKGAAGLAQQVRKNRSLPRRLSAQKSPKGAAGLAQQVRKNRSPPRRLSAQKSPKGAAGLAQQMQKRQHQTVRAKTDYNHTRQSIQRLRRHRQARAHNYIIQAFTHIQARAPHSTSAQP
jgi:hypothetical protein